MKDPGAISDITKNIAAFCTGPTFIVNKNSFSMFNGFLVFGGTNIRFSTTIIHQNSIKVNKNKPAVCTAGSHGLGQKRVFFFYTTAHLINDFRSDWSLFEKLLNKCLAGTCRHSLQNEVNEMCLRYFHSGTSSCAFFLARPTRRTKTAWPRPSHRKPASQKLLKPIRPQGKR